MTVHVLVEYPARDGEEHRRQSYEWLALETKSERGDYFKENGVRWTELARLPYLDLVRCTVIDPMHNLLLGIVKTQWYSQWIKENALRRATTTQGRELDVVHQFLETFESPLWAGKLPLRVGEPAGGSLSADEYKFAAMTALPIIVRDCASHRKRFRNDKFQIPIVWDLFEDEAVSEFQSAQSRYETAMKVYDAALEKWNASQAGGEPSHENAKKRKINEKPTPPKPPSIRMQSDEASNFLRLATALKIILSSSIDEAQLDRAEALLEEYLLLYGADAMKPNHHWSRHITNQIRDFGPVYSFWTFVSERLNKLLKNFNSNSWKGGQMEISMMRSFGRDALLHEMV
ncbi:hypothetical protein BD410DRAFT_732539 [Rickenella mellea]|uniref:Uncharacterized protein n=1 Tax=Rickenella mellea TaxID=50990 RepID=A0A4Y7PKC1_9AGAM|nr:hypothetical protein BD410DRAFT_732539 [Rickenella mellea]